MSSETWKLERDLCRCCHAEGSFTSLAEPSRDLAQGKIFSELLRHCFDINIRPVEGTYIASTYTICEPCVLRLRDASSFKQQVLLCEERFRDMYRNVTGLGVHEIEIKIKQEDPSSVQYELKEEMNDDELGVGDGHDDAPLPKQPRLETNDDETEQVDPQKETQGPEEITSNVDLNKNTSTDITTREVNGEGATNNNDNKSLNRIQTPVILQNVFICNDGSKRVDNKHTLAVHIASHEELKQDNNLKCKECSYQTETRDSLERHSTLHDGNSCFICDICGYAANRKQRLVNHLKSKHIHLQSTNIWGYKSNENSNMKKNSRNLCLVCGYNSKFRINSEQNLRIIDNDKKLYSCSFCEYKSTLKANLTRHLRIHTGEKPFSCSICEYKCTTKASLTIHITRIHTGKKPFSCSFCEHKCSAKSDLTKHLRIHTGNKPFSCTFCVYKCAAKSDLTKHLQIHTDDKRHSCSFCEYKCSSKPVLNKHLRIHIKPFSCSFCEYKCALKHNLKTHLLIHTGEKPFSCSFCDYKCALKRRLRVHLLTHTNEKPYCCSLCEYKFASKSDLTRHLRIHTGEKLHSCSFCEYRCVRKSDLKDHVLIHTGEKPFSCSFCGYKCARKTNLKNHLRIHIDKK